MKHLLTLFAFTSALAPTFLFAGMQTPAMATAKPGAVRPAGWLKDRALAARNGFTGHMEEIDEHFRLAWTTNCMRRGSHLRWEDSHRGSWSAEGGAYWFDGLVKLAFQLDDPELKAMAKRRLDTLLDNVGTNTIAFLWWYDRTKPEDVQDAFEHGSWRFWTAGISERALAAWWEATGDARVERVLSNVFGYREMFERSFSPSMGSAAVDAYRITHNPIVAEDAKIWREKITNGWLAHYTEKPWNLLHETLNLRRLHLYHYKMPDRHGVMASEILLSLLRVWQLTGEEKLKDLVLSWYGFFDKHCRQPYGVTMMDEEWGFAGVKRGTETCDVAAEMFTRENILAALGDGKWGDDVEKAFFNAGPACVSRDFKRHVYFQMPNRVGQAGESARISAPCDEHLNYNLSTWPLCCTAALNRILPNYLLYSWLTTADGGIAATLYGPTTFETMLPSGSVALTEKTNYPFDETIEISVDRSPEKAFPLKLRLPAWCKTPEVTINSEKADLVPQNGFVTFNRIWRKGDRLVLRLPMAPRFEDFNDRNDNATLRRSVVLGPLLFAYAIPSTDDNTPAVRPVREPSLASSLKPADLTVERRPMPDVWNWPENSPLAIRATASDGAVLNLVPYGCTKLRISAFTVK